MSGARDVAFTSVAFTAMSGYDGEAAVLVGSNDATRARIRQLVPGASLAPERVLVAALQGSQRTGGYAVHISSIERDGERLIVHAAFAEPRPDSIVTQVLTSPADVVSIAAADAQGVSQVVLLDETGAERARSATR